MPMLRPYQARVVRQAQFAAQAIWAGSRSSAHAAARHTSLTSTSRPQVFLVFIAANAVVTVSELKQTSSNSQRFQGWVVKVRKASSCFVLSSDLSSKRSL